MRTQDEKIALVQTLLDNGIDAYLEQAGENASFEGFIQHVKEIPASMLAPSSEGPNDEGSS